MKAITVQQPWAWAITAGHKPIENRTWAPDHRGSLAIHAGKTFDLDGVTTFDRVMAEIRMLPPKWYREPGTLAAGALVAVARLTGVCLKSLRTPTVVCDCGPWAMPGQFHWQLTKVRPLPEPVPARGRLGLWDTNLTEVTHG